MLLSDLYWSNDVWYGINERVRKRALYIILPGKPYREDLSAFNCLRLDGRRDELCERTIKRMSDGDRSSHLFPQSRGNTRLIMIINVILTIGDCLNVELIVSRKVFFQKLTDPTI